MVSVMSRLLVVGVAAASLVASAGQGVGAEPTIVEAVVDDKDLDLLQGLATDLGLVPALSGVTVLAPTDKAFTQFLTRTLSRDARRFLLNPDGTDAYAQAVLAELIKYHVAAPDNLLSPAVIAAGSARFSDLLSDPALNWALEPVFADGKINGQAKPDELDIELADGVVHKIKKVLVPGVQVPGGEYKPGIQVVNSVVEIAQELGIFRRLLKLTERAGLKGLLDGQKFRAKATTGSNTPVFTVFAPVDAAFEALGDTLKFVRANSRLLDAVLKYHVLVGAKASTAIGGIPALGASEDTFLAAPGQNPYEDGAGSLDTSSLPAIVDAAGQTANVAVANVLAFNGVVHAIDKVLLPLDVSSLTTISQLAVDAGFSTLVAALQAASDDDLDLVQLFDKPGEYTVFAPTNDAFAALGQEYDLARLLQAKKLLRSILFAHVVPEALFAAEVSQRRRVMTLCNRVTVNSIALQDGGLDNAALNGVVHIIDEVIIPKGYAKRLRKFKL